MNVARITSTIGLLLLLAGCVTQTENTAPDAVIPPAAPAEEMEQTEQVPERAFPIETFYALLVAEIAGSREQYNIALGNYMQQAEATRDPDIAARATRIARFLNARKSALKASLLWADVSPEDAEARFTAASELLRHDQLLEAASHCRALLEMESATLYQSIAARAERVDPGTRHQLAEEFQLRLSEHPDNTDLLVGLGLIHQSLGEQKTAMKYALAAQEKDPSLVSAAVLESRLLHEMGRHEQALRKLSELIDAQPDNSRLRLQYARMLASSDLAEAQRQFAILLEQNPEDQDLVFSLGLISFQQGNIDEARQYLKLLVDDSRHHSAAHYYLGRMAEQDEDWQSALEHYLRVQGGPNFMTALLRSTEILVRAGESEAAGKRLSGLRQRLPEDAEKLYLMEAEVLNKYQHLDNAVSVLNSALIEYPGSSQLLYSRAMIFEQLDRLPELEADLRQIIDRDPDNATVLNALGYTLADRTQRYHEAEKLIARALQLKPGDPAILDSMGWVKYRLGDNEEAAILLQQAMEAMPDHEIAAHLGEVLWIMGQKENARKIWTQGLKLNPASDILREALERFGVVELSPPPPSPEP